MQHIQVNLKYFEVYENLMSVGITQVVLIFFNSGWLRVALSFFTKFKVVSKLKKKPNINFVWDLIALVAIFCYISPNVWKTWLLLI